jgi:hypothetical protein
LKKGKELEAVYKEEALGDYASSDCLEAGAMNNKLEV